MVRDAGASFDSIGLSEELRQIGQEECEQVARRRLEGRLCILNDYPVVESVFILPTIPPVIFLGVFGFGFASKS